MKDEQFYNEFLTGFAVGAKLKTRTEADEQWAAWSRQMSDLDRHLVEIGGWHSGYNEGDAMICCQMCALDNE